MNSSYARWKTRDDMFVLVLVTQPLCQTNVWIS